LFVKEKRKGKKGRPQSYRTTKKEVQPSYSSRSGESGSRDLRGEKKIAGAGQEGGGKKEKGGGGIRNSTREGERKGGNTSDAGFVFTLRKKDA